MTAPSNTPALEQFEAAVVKERAENELLEVAFYPGTDRDVTHEDAARVGMDMYARFKDGKYVDITNRPL